MSLHELQAGVLQSCEYSEMALQAACEAGERIQQVCEMLEDQQGPDNPALFQLEWSLISGSAEAGQSGIIIGAVS